MDLVQEIRERNETALGAAKELGRGLMRGNREELRLGYDWRNAGVAAGKAYSLARLDHLELTIHLLGFSAGMRDAVSEDEFCKMRDRFSEHSEHYRAAWDDGFRRGQDEDANVYPAGA